MKHDLKITIILIIVFFLAQIVGLFGILFDHDLNPRKFAPDIKEIPPDLNIDYNKITGNPEEPEIENKSLSFIPIMISVFIGTFIALLLIRFKALKLFKLWFFIGIALCLKIALSPFLLMFFLSLIPSLIMIVSPLSYLFGFVFSFFRLFRYNFFVHNITEIMLYGGLAILVVAILNIESAFILLLVISLYDMYAVWKSKHMIVLAKSQMENRIFSGVMIPYEQGSGKIFTHEGKGDKKAAAKTAILGGGDIAFPLVFAGAVMTDKGFLTYLSEDGYLYAAPMLWFGMLISFCAGLALIFLFIYGKKDKFYPAMPFISLGCFAGYAIGLVIFKLFFMGL